MNTFLKFYSTTIGKKAVMAVTGLAMILFVLGHMLGNLKFFGSIDPVTGVHKLDHYAEYLKLIGADLLGKETFLWFARIGLLICIVLHFISAFQLARLNRKAKPINNRKFEYKASSAASRTMMWGGIALLLFVVLHILHFTTGHVHTVGFEHGKVFDNVYQGFQIWYVAFGYVLAMAALMMHLYHGTWSMFQTLGVDSPKWNGGIRMSARVLAVFLFVGFSVVPLAAYFQLVPQITKTSINL